MVGRWIHCCFCLLSSSIWAEEATLPDVKPDWQLPYTTTDDFVVYADTRGTHVRYTDGNSYTLLNDGRGFSPVVTEHYIYATSLNGSLLAWDRSQRETLWHRRFDSWVFPPLIIGEDLYLAGQASDLLKLNSKTGVTLDSVPLTNEAIFSPVNWGDGQIGVGAYARLWHVVELNPFQQVEQFEVPEPPITATPDGRFLSQFGNLYQRLRDGHFTQLVEGNNSVSWFDTRGYQLYWAGGSRLWSSGLDGLKCLEANSPFTHIGFDEHRYRLQTADVSTTSPTPMSSWHWDNTPIEQEEKETNDDKENANWSEHSADRQHGIDVTCRALRD